MISIYSGFGLSRFHCMHYFSDYPTKVTIQLMLANVHSVSEISMVSPQLKCPCLRLVRFI